MSECWCRNDACIHLLVIVDHLSIVRMHECCVVQTPSHLDWLPLVGVSLHDVEHLDPGVGNDVGQVDTTCVQSVLI